MTDNLPPEPHDHTLPTELEREEAIAAIKQAMANQIEQSMEKLDDWLRIAAGDWISKEERDEHIGRCLINSCIGDCIRTVVEEFDTSKEWPRGKRREGDSDEN